MPSKKQYDQSEDEKNKNLTLRLPEEYHRQLVGQAARRGLTLNALLIGIVHRHLLESGYAPNVIKSHSGRLFEIEVEPVRDRLRDYFCCRFDVFENHLLYNKRRAHYLIGLSEPLAYQANDPFGLVKDVGIAMLNFYNRRGLEIDQLAWQTSSKDPPSPSPTMKDNWRYIGISTTKNIGEFLIALARNHWKDDLVVSTGQSQDIRCELRSEADLYR
jgi:hypothetical protein